MRRCDLNYFRFQNYRNLVVLRKKMDRGKTPTVHLHVLTKLGDAYIFMVL